MTTVTVNAEIDGDGNLRLEVPLGLPAGKAEVVLVVQPQGANGRNETTQSRPARSGLFAGKSGKTADIDAALDEMNKVWKSKLSDLT